MPGGDQEFTKGQVNRGARLLLDFGAAAGSNITDDELWATFGLDAVRQADAAVAWWRGLHAGPLAAVNANLRHYLRDLSLPINVTQRLKRRVTILDKLRREPRMNLTQMGDIGGVRAIVGSIDEIYAVSRALRKNWEVERTRDYIKEPKESGYRAVHHIVIRKKRRIEVQLRTPRQDAWANAVEEDGRRLRIGLKSGFGPGDVHEFYVAVADLFALQDAGVEPDEEARAHARELYEKAQPFLEPGV